MESTLAIARKQKTRREKKNLIQDIVEKSKYSASLITPLLERSREVVSKRTSLISRFSPTHLHDILSSFISFGGKMKKTLGPFDNDAKRVLFI